jgi:SUMO ligase MMS21 Smc5/6 complex component
LLIISCLKLGSQYDNGAVAATFVWRRFGMKENINDIKHLIQQKNNDLLMEKMTESMLNKKKEHDLQMEEKRQRIYRAFLHSRAGPTSVLSDLYGRF